MDPSKVSTAIGLTPCERRSFCQCVPVHIPWYGIPGHQRRLRDAEGAINRWLRKVPPLGSTFVLPSAAILMRPSASDECMLNRRRRQSKRPAQILHIHTTYIYSIKPCALGRRPCPFRPHLGPISDFSDFSRPLVLALALPLTSSYSWLLACGRENGNAACFVRSG